MMKRISPVLAVAALFGLLAACGSSRPVWEGLSADSLLAYGTEQLEDRDWDEAIAALQQFTYQFPSHAGYEQARYRLGEAFFGKGEYITAASEFARVSTDFPSGEYSDDARFKVCESYAELSPKPQLDQQYTVAALDHCAAFTTYFPDSPLAPRATEIAQEMRNKLAHKIYMAGDYYMKINAFDSAVQYFNQALDEYPDSDIAPKLLFRLYEAYTELGYREEAQSARERLVRDFPNSEEARRIGGIQAGDRA
jgi:outer membrane protein assembly factor BamD